LASVFVQKPSPQDLLKIYGQLLSRQGMVLVERIAKLLLLGVAETKAILDLCKWPDDKFKELLTVLSEYETYKTLDVQERKRSTVQLNEGRMQRGQFLTMSNKKLVRLSKVSPEYFSREVDNILTHAKSLSTLIEDFEKHQDIVKVVKIVEDITKSGIEDLRARYPEKFTARKLEKFIGAEIRNKVTNSKGELLKKYITSVSMGTDEDLLLDLKEIAETKTVSEVVSEIIKEGDSLVINFDKTSDDDPEELFNKLIDKNVTSVLLFPNESQQLDALCLLRMKQSEIFQVQQLLFEKEKSSKKGENVDFGILCGNLSTLYDGPVDIFNGRKANIINVIERIVPPGGKIFSITDMNTDPLIVHKKELSRKVSYVCYKDQLEIVETRIKEEGSFIHTENVEAERINDIGDRAINVATPVLSTKGIDEDSSQTSGSVEDSDSDGEDFSDDEDHVQNTPGCSASSQAFTSTPKSSAISNSFKTMTTKFGSRLKTTPINQKEISTSPYNFESTSESPEPESKVTKERSSLTLETVEETYSQPTQGPTVSMTSESNSSQQDSYVDTSLDSNTILPSTPQPPTGIEVQDGKITRYHKTDEEKMNVSTE